MDAASIIGYVLQAFDLIPKLIVAGKDIGAYIDNVKVVLKTAQETGEPIPDAAWDELKATREELQERLHAPDKE